MEFTSIMTTVSVCCTSATTTRRKEKANEDRSREEQRLYYVALTRAKARLYLPLVPGKLGGKKWEGGYARLNERLSAVTSDIEELANRDLFQIVTFQDRPIETGRDTLNLTGGEPATWLPDPALLKSTRPCPRVFGISAQTRRLRRFIVFADEARRGTGILTW